MLLALVLFGLITVGFVVPCLIDVAVTPPGKPPALSVVGELKLLLLVTVIVLVPLLPRGTLRE